MKDRHGMESQASSGQEAPKAVKKLKSLRKRNRHPVAIALFAVAVAAGVGTYFVASPYLSGPPFPPLTGEGWVHLHPYLVISIEGRNVTIPGGVGLVQGGTAFEPVHTHDASGLLHIELSQTDAASHSYTLGDFFTIWNYTARTAGGAQVPTLNGKPLSVEFSPTSILGFRSNSTYHVVLLVDGKPSTQWGALDLEQLDYCGQASTGSPCCPTDCSGSVAVGPLWNGGQSYPYGTGHTIVIRYVKG
jgi:hypothetical protein